MLHAPAALTVGNKHLVTSRSVMIWLRVKCTHCCNPKSRTSHTHFFLYASQITHQVSTNCAVTGFCALSPSDHFLTFKFHKNPIAAKFVVWNERRQTPTNMICHSLLEQRNMGKGRAHLDKHRTLLFVHDFKYEYPLQRCISSHQLHVFQRTRTSFGLLSAFHSKCTFLLLVSPVASFFFGLLLN